MKKFPVFLLMMFVSLFIWAQENQENFDNFDDFAPNIQEPEAIEIKEFNEVNESNESNENDKEPPKPSGFRLKNRTVELSVANISVGFSNDFIAFTDIFQSPFYMLRNINTIRQNPKFIYQDNIVIDFDKFFEGFTFNFNADIKPVSFNFNWKDKWGFGFDIGHISATGNVSVSENVLRLERARDEEIDTGAAVFVDVGVPVFFHVDEVKIKIRPAAYVPILYTKPSITYTHKDKDGGSYIEVVYDMRLYTIIDVNDDDIMQNLQNYAQDIPKNNMGYDLGLNVEYPWNYDLDVGMNMVNIPIPYATAKLHYYSRSTGYAKLDTSRIDLSDLGDEDKSPEDVLENAWDEKHETIYGYDSDGKKIYRPFSTLFYLNYRPFDTKILSLIPSLGFSLNWLYNKIFSVEGGLNVRFDFANIFIPVFGINYNDRIWRNSVDLAFNLRVFEIDFGLSMQSRDFIKSFQGVGLGANFGIKLGW